jgi:uncharacterized protein (TIGR02145 family)
MKKSTLILIMMSLLVINISAQNLEVVGQAKITVMPTDNAADQIVVKKADGTLAVRSASTLKELPSSPQAGEMLYWNGTAWVVVDPGNQGQFLRFFNGTPVWTPEVGSTDVVSLTGKVWMDRNLGASQVATSSNDAASYGDLYQWGRRTDGHENRTSMTSPTLSSSDTPSNGDFITTNSSPNDWRSPQNNNLWQGVSGINNPCPSGYRVPTDAEWDAERMSWSSNNAAGALASPLKLPLAGSRDVSNGSLISVGTFGGYWSSTVSGTGARRLGFVSGTANMITFSRANGRSVRCLKD